MNYDEENPEFMGGSWYCATCGTEFSPVGGLYPTECVCPYCNTTLLRSGGHR